MTAPAVSVCVPTHNGARYLERAIHSVLEQDFPDWELVICDDASTDGTPELVGRYRDERVRYRRFAERAGQAGNFNRCLREATGRHLTLLHADDFFLPGFLGRRVAELDDAEAAGFAFGAVRLVDEHGNDLGVRAPWEADRRFPAGALVPPLLHGCLISPPSLMVRREVALAAGPFREDLTWGHDWDWSLRLAEIAAANYSCQPLAAYRVHDGSGTAEILRLATNGAQERRILNQALARTRGPRARELRRGAFQALARRHLYFAEEALLADRRRVACYNLRFALLADPALIAKPTWWALGAGAIGGAPWYLGYRKIRALVRGVA